ncbi:hypothetical protein [Subtercola vilae]|nr:hypothetical protein [Subtercola vilae]
MILLGLIKIIIGAVFLTGWMSVYRKNKPLTKINASARSWAGLR